MRAAVPFADDHDLEGQVLGRHRLDRLVRDGGMGGVFLGQHVDTGARVAIKVQHADAVGDPSLAARFDREAQVMGRLSGCGGIVGVRDVGSIPDGRRYVVMDFIRGLDLSDLLSEYAAADELMPVDRACEILADVASALHVVHTRDVIHRDLKPANIMLEALPGDRERALLLDFGISADRGERGRVQALTGSGEVLGTPQYMAPEQAAGVRVTPAVDIYAMGAVLHQMLSGLAPPRQGWRVAKVPLDEVRDLPPRLSALAAGMLDADPRKRPETAADVEVELRMVLDELRSGVRVDAAGRASYAVAGSIEAPDKPEPDPTPLPCSAVERPREVSRPRTLHPLVLGALFGVTVALSMAVSAVPDWSSLASSLLGAPSAVEGGHESQSSASE